MNDRRWTWLAGDTRRKPRALTIGVFDGVHLGHRALLELLGELARERGLDPMVLTFDPHPLAVVAPEKAPELLTTTACRLRLLCDAGASSVAALRFDRELAALTPEQFVREVLVDDFDARVVVASAAFRFGAGARGDVAAMRRIGAEVGIEVIEIRPVVADARRVSSTRVRHALAAGDVSLAAKLLGRPHLVEGVVERGLARGRTLGFPTANLGQVEVLVPGEGIYAAWASSGDVVRPAAVHVGRRLTFEGASTLEAHLLDFDAAMDLYGRPMTLAFVQRLRDDVRFAGPAELAAQIGRDVEAVRAMLGGAPPDPALGACRVDLAAGG
ncbi:MAG: riboflavin biosynthesis protein RibF [Deltaproteobacteria bacterium]|nr:riboflavin biosynthesis protein RibF [Deltaproteobacteria bacterium]